MEHDSRLTEDSREKIRKLIVNLVFTTYWIAIFEGALRKWFLPGYGTIIYFAKDLFVLIAYWLAFNTLFPYTTLFRSNRKSVV